MRLNIRQQSKFSLETKRLELSPVVSGVQPANQRFGFFRITKICHKEI